MIYENHGKIAVEGRSESFIIHAGYGLSPRRVPVGELRLGDKFWAPREGAGGEDRQWTVTLLAEDRVEGREEQFSTIQPFFPTLEVRVPGEEFDEDAPLAKFWHVLPHPKFEIADLDDLIAALEAYREAKRG
jgi:hypothetical protein